MSILTRIFGNAADTYAFVSNTVYATARASTATTSGNAAATNGNFGQNFNSPNYNVQQAFLQFDTSAVPASSAGQLSIYSLAAVASAVDTFEVSQVSAITNKIAGASLSSQTILGTIAASALAFGRFSISLTGTIPVSATLRYLLSSARERLNTAPTGDERAALYLADQTGTTNDPYLQIISGTAWDHVGTSVTGGVTTASHTLTEPAGVAEGDLLVAAIGSRIASATQITLPSGWTRIGQQLNNNTATTSSALPSGMMAYIIRGASAPNYTFTHPVAPSIAIGTVSAYRNVHQTTPLDTGVTQVTTATAITAVSVAGLTTTADDDLLVAMCAGGQEAAWDTFNATDPGTSSGTTNSSTLDPIWGQWLERHDLQSTVGSDTSLATFDAVKQTAGATGNFTATASVSAGHVVIVGSFRLAPSGPAAAVGTLSVTLDALTAAGTGEVTTPERTGTLAATLGAATLAGVGNVPSQGTLAATLGDATLLATGTAVATSTGALSATLDAATLAASGTVANQVFTGTLSSTLAAASLVATGSAPAQGTLAATLGTATLAAIGKAPSQGTLSVTLGAATLAASGTVANQVFSGTLAATLGNATLSATGTVVNQVFSGTLSATLGNATLSASGTVANVVSTGTLSATLAAATLASSGAVPSKGTLSATLGLATLAATGAVTAKGTLAVTLGDVSGTLTGKVSVGGTAAGTLAPATLVATGNVADKVSSGTLSATLAAASLAATGTVRNQVFTGTLSAQLDAATLAATGKLLARGTVAVTLDAATLAASGTVANKVSFGTLSATLAPATLAATGTVRNASTGTLSSTLGAATLAATGRVRIGGALAVSLGDVTATATGKVAVEGTAAGTLFPAVLVATGTVANQVFAGALAATLDDATLLARGRAGASISPPRHVDLEGTKQETEIPLVGIMQRAVVLHGLAQPVVMLAAHAESPVALQARMSRDVTLPALRAGPINLPGVRHARDVLDVPRRYKAA